MVTRSIWVSGRKVISSAMVDILHEAVCFIDLQGHSHAVNLQAVTMLGCSDAVELLQNSIFVLAPESQHERIRNDLLRGFKMRAD